MCKYYWAFVWLSTKATSQGLGAGGGRGGGQRSKVGPRTEYENGGMGSEVKVVGG